MRWLFSSRVLDAVPENQAWCSFLAIYYCYHHRGECHTSPVLFVSLIQIPQGVGFILLLWKAYGVWHTYAVYTPFIAALIKQ